MLMGGLRMLLCGARMLLALRMVTFAVMLGSRTMSLGCILVVLSCLVVFVSSHFCSPRCFAPSLRRNFLNQRTFHMGYGSKPTHHSATMNCKRAMNKGALGDSSDMKPPCPTGSLDGDQEWGKIAKAAHASGRFHE
jgi:polyferredoxin